MKEIRIYTLSVSSISNRYIKSPPFPSQNFSLHPQLSISFIYPIFQPYNSLTPASLFSSTQLTMSSDAAPAAPVPSTFGDNKGIKFSIKTGGARYQCVIQDRSI